MKVFLSWSKNTSHEVAKAFKEWLPLVIQSIDPYVSSEDIDKGARWSSEIAKELEECSFGIICVTKDNLEEPWLMFEAGALSKRMNDSFVCPFLLNVKRSDIKGPLAQFQSVAFEKKDVLNLLKTINGACKEASIGDSVLEKSFETWWPEFENKLKAIKGKSVEKPVVEEGAQKDDILEELLEMTRSNQRILSNPTSLFPSEYLDRIIRNAVGNEKTPVNVAQNIQMLNSILYQLRHDWDVIYPTVNNCLAVADKTGASQLLPIASRINGGIYQVQQAVWNIIQMINQEGRVL